MLTFPRLSPYIFVYWLEKNKHMIINNHCQKPIALQRLVDTLLLDTLLVHIEVTLQIIAFKHYMASNDL